MKEPTTNKQLLTQLRRIDSGKVDRLFQDAHERVFACTDCLKCANCCKTTGPRFTDRDIDRIAKHLRISVPAFEAKYLRMDEDGDHVLQQVPCAFLGADNYCSIYEVRPKACREYPHTDRVKQVQIFQLTEKNAVVCPAVQDILNEVRTRWEKAK